MRDQRFEASDSKDMINLESMRRRDQTLRVNASKEVISPENLSSMKGGIKHFDAKPFKTLIRYSLDLILLYMDELIMLVWLKG
jgi:hypothetical protein